MSAHTQKKKHHFITRTYPISISKVVKCKELPSDGTFSTVVINKNWHIQNCRVTKHIIKFSICI